MKRYVYANPDRVKKEVLKSIGIQGDEDKILKRIEELYIISYNELIKSIRNMESIERVNSKIKNIQRLSEKYSLIINGEYSSGIWKNRNNSGDDIQVVDTIEDMIDAKNMELDKSVLLEGKLPHNILAQYKLFLTDSKSNIGLRKYYKCISKLLKKELPITEFVKEISAIKWAYENLCTPESRREYSTKLAVERERSSYEEKRNMASKYKIVTSNRKYTEISEKKAKEKVWHNEYKQKIIIREKGKLEYGMGEILDEQIKSYIISIDGREYEVYANLDGLMSGEINKNKIASRIFDEHNLRLSCEYLGGYIGEEQKDENGRTIINHDMSIAAACISEQQEKSKKTESKKNRDEDMLNSKETENIQEIIRAYNVLREKMKINRILAGYRQFIRKDEKSKNQYAVVNSKGEIIGFSNEGTLKYGMAMEDHSIEKYNIQIEDKCYEVFFEGLDDQLDRKDYKKFLANIMFNKEVLNYSINYLNGYLGRITRDEKGNFVVNLDKRAAQACEKSRSSRVDDEER